MPTDLNDFLTRTQAASLLGVSARTFSRRSAQPDFPKPIRPDLKVILYRRADLIDWMDKASA